MFKRCKINILPANQISPLSFVGVKKKTLCYDKKLLKKLSKLSWFMSGYSLYELTKTIQFQHLYITTNDKVKIGDWYLVELYDVTGHSTGLHLERCNSIDDVWINPIGIDLTRHINNCRKIIATTDKLPLETYQGHFNDVDCTRYLPQPSQSFIEKYLEEYNKGNKIVDILVEYESIGRMKSSGKETSIIDILKVSKDNTINIKPLKELWTTKEVKQLCWQAFINFKCLEGKIKPYDAELLLTPFNEWVKKNL